ncbi:hypothetical protein [Pantanalinema sp. GBBB05]|uniref:hypothetical protein n=1 Tax=Pantanalinema sp. GBBB05 TaxID=2604139 RepID=UPI001DA49144|nr:hypothetical protein [Pantanalinema sp. GBBB05]
MATLTENGARSQLTFSPDGKLYAADGDTGNLFWIDPRSTQVFQIGSLGTGSSGDLVFNGEYEILAIARGEISDRLMAVDISTGKARTIGDLGFQDVLGLALTNGVLSAYTSSGQKLVIDPQTGIASVQETVAGITGQIWGAADNPSRSGIVVGELPQIPQTGELPDPEPIPQERQTTPVYLDQTYRFQTADRASGDAIGGVPWWQVSDRPPQNVVNAFRWAYSERHSDNGVPRMGAPSGPIRLQTLAGQRVWVQEFATGGSFNSRGLIVMRESDSNSTDYNRTAIALFGEPLGWRVDLMGLPRSNPIPATRSPQGTDGWYIPFEYGSQHWTRQNFANKSIWRDYQAEYERLGGSGGWLGFPTYDPEAYSPPNTYGQRWEIARFEGGVIIWGSAVGAFSFSWQDVNSNSGKWRQFWNAIAQGRSRDEIRTLLDNPYSVFRENTNSNTGWATNVYRWDRNQGQPPANFWDNTANFLATINLGSNVRSDGKKGINLQDWRDGSPRGDRLPSDFFAMRSYTSAYFEAGKRYRAMVRADDGYQLFAKKQDNQRWVHFTPENQWQTDAYGAYKEVVFDVPETGWYDFHFHHYEGGGNAYFDLYWEELPSLLPTSAKQAEAFFKLQFKHSKYNPTGPSYSNNCGPASLAMLIKTLGLEPPGISIETSIDHARYLMFPDDPNFSEKEGVRVLNRDSAYTGDGNMRVGIQRAGGRAEEYSTWNDLDHSLMEGKPLVANGRISSKWRDQFPEPTLYGSGGDFHYIAVLGKTPNGKYIVADPMYKGGPVEMTKNQLAVFRGENARFLTFTTS